MRWNKIQKILRIFWNKFYKYGRHKQKNVRKSNVETIVENGGTLQLNEKPVEKRLEDKILRINTGKFNSGHWKHRSNLLDEPNNQPNGILMDKESAIKIIMVCKTRASTKI